MSPKGQIMWLENLKEVKKQTKMSSKQIADKSGLPERTVTRIFSGETENPTVDTVHRIVVAMGASLDDVFADTKVVVACERLVDIKEAATAAEAERDVYAAENAVLRSKLSALSSEIELLSKELKHKDELLALHAYYKTHIEHLTHREVT